MIYIKHATIQPASTYVVPGSTADVASSCISDLPDIAYIFVYAAELIVYINSSSLKQPLTSSFSPSILITV